MPSLAGTANTRTPIGRIGVVVPVNNQEHALPACLEGLRVAARQVALPITVIVVLDSCTDLSALMIDTACNTETYTVKAIVVNARNVGFARRAGMTYFLRDHPARGTWLATTDADSVVPENWFTAQLNHADAGAHVVAGTVVVQDWQDWQDRSDAVRDRAVGDYLVTPHRPIHGANLSFAATAYEAAGGFPPLVCEEDVALVDAFRDNGEPVVWALDLPVVTSARRRAGAPRGFARYLSSSESSLDGVVDGR